MRKDWIPYFIVSVILAGGLAFSYVRTDKVRQDQSERSIDVDAFLVTMCERDAFRDKIIIQALTDAKRRASESLRDQPIKREFEVERIQHTIDLLRLNIAECLSNVPEP